MPKKYIVATFNTVCILSKLKIWLTLFGVLFYAGSFSQYTENSKELSYLDFYGLVIENHPVVKLANLEIDYAQAELMIARGAFDPKLTSTFNRKSIDGKDYYNEWATDLKVPVWGGIDFKAGQERNFGERLNPELTSGLSNYAGFSVPLGRGLLLEERRNTLEQTKIYQQIAGAERQKILNKIIFSATKDYWEWYLTYQTVTFNLEGLNLAKERFEFIRNQVKIGEKAGVDSLEAKIALQTRTIDYQKSKVDFRNATLILSTYLWGKENQPLELSENVIPMRISTLLVDEIKLKELVERAKNAHPEVQKLIFKSEQLIFQEKFQKELLKPKLDFSYNFINTPKYNLSELGVIRTNNKIGLDFEMPLYLRKERGKLQQVKIKQLQIANDQQLLNREILNQIYAAYNQLVTFSELLGIQNEVNQNQELLLLAEREKFRIGESSLFLINSRETKLIELKIKAEELKAKYEKAYAELIFAAGQSSLP